MNLQGQFYYVENNIPVGPFPLDELLTKKHNKKNLHLNKWKLAED